MSTQALCGLGGSVNSVSGATEVTTWECTLNVAAEDATSMASLGWRERLPCLRGGSGTFKTIAGSATIGAHASANFKVSNAGFSITGDIVINKIDIETPVSGIVSFNHSFTFTGQITAGAFA